MSHIHAANTKQRLVTMSVSLHTQTVLPNLTIQNPKYKSPLQGSFTRTVSVSVAVKLFYYCVNGNGPSSCRMGMEPILQEDGRLHSHNDNNLTATETETVRVKEPS